MKRSRQTNETSLSISPPQKPANVNLSTLHTPVSPPRTRSAFHKPADHSLPTAKGINQEPPALAAIEAGHVQVSDHLSIFSSRLQETVRSPPGHAPRLSIQDWVDLYQRNQRVQGRHFVIHQHDHPVAGPHYDLRLQFSDSSSVSWSVMYGLPGNPNSRRINRNATETRVHCLWSHLAETASAKTGSMIIWDTGEYEILPYHEEPSGPETDDSRSNASSDFSPPGEQMSDSEKLRQAFQNRKIRLRLHGARLPPGYTIILRLAKAMDIETPIRPPRKRQKRNHSSNPKNARPPSTSSSGSSPERGTPVSRLSNQDVTPLDTSVRQEHSDSEDDIDHRIRSNNAYPGSTNSIGSVHQRRWFITLDRINSGFTHELEQQPGRKRWVRKQDGSTGRLLGFDPFYVRGPEVERSIITARLAKDVLEDEGVEGFNGRRGWRPVLE